jgi:hypothetical protein
VVIDVATGAAVGPAIEPVTGPGNEIPAARTCTTINATRLAQPRRASNVIKPQRQKVVAERMMFMLTAMATCIAKRIRAGNNARKMAGKKTSSHRTNNRMHPGRMHLEKTHPEIIPPEIITLKKTHQGIRRPETSNWIAARPIASVATSELTTTILRAAEVGVAVVAVVAAAGDVSHL